MSITHVIIKWLNRVVLSILFLLVILGFSIDDEMLFYALLFTICIGFTQFLSGVVLSFKNHIDLEKKKIRIYMIIASLYLFCFFLSINFLKNVFMFKEDFTPFLLIGIPVLLALYFTYLTETVGKK